MSADRHSTSRPRQPIAFDPHGHPRTFRLAAPRREAAYRRLAVAILGLDVATVASSLRSARRAA